MSRHARLLGRVAATIVVIVSVVGCGSGSGAPTAPTGTLGGATAPQTGTPTSTIALPTTATPAESPVAGSVRFRVVHVYAPLDGSAATVDVITRTQGLVQAQLQIGGIGIGTATDYFAPPQPGSVVLAKAGVADGSCVIDCTDFYGEATTTSGQGDQRTLLLYGYDDPFATGTTLADVTEVMDLWEHPDAASIGSFANAIPPADASKASVFVIGAAVPEARFGLRLAIDGTAGCQSPADGSASMIGGNQVIAFDLAPGSRVTLHDTSDPDCTGEPAGGPFEVGSVIGGRAYLILYGDVGAMEALAVPIP